MDINVRNSLPTARFNDESVEAWLRDVYRRLEDLERKSLSLRVSGPTPSGGGGAGAHLPFVTIGNTPQLTAERSLIEGDYINITDGGPNSSVSVALDISALDTHNSGLFLRLDTTNDPLTGPLDIESDDVNALRVLTEGVEPPLSTALDSFNRANSSPLDGGWDMLGLSYNTDPDLVDNHVEPNPDLMSVSLWNGSTISADCDVWATTPLVPTDENSAVAVFSRMSYKVDIEKWEGYGLWLTSLDGLGLLRVIGWFGDEGGYGYGVLATYSTGVPLENGCTILLRTVGDTLTPAFRTASGAWTVFESVSGGGNNTSGQIGIGVIGVHTDEENNDLPVQLDDFGGSDVVSSVLSEEIFNVDTIGKIVTARRLKIDQLTGGSPLIVTSTTLNTNLNADLLDGQHASAFQPAGNYITALTGDVTATGPGSVTATLATVNANVGTFGSATQVSQVTVNGKGLITAAANVTIAGVAPFAHDVLSAYHGDTLAAAVARGDLIVGNSTPKWSRLALGGITGSVLTRNATDIAWSTGALSFGGAFTLTISGNSTINGSLVGNITGGGTLATGGFTGTIPESMTFAGRNVANTFTAVQTITAPNSTALTGGFIFTQTKTGTAGGVYKFTDLTGTIDLPSDAGGAQDFYLMNALIQTAADATVYNSANLRSFYLSPQHNGSGTINTAVGGYVHIFNNGAGNISTGIGYISRIVNIGTGKIVNTRNFWAMNITNTGGGTAPDTQYAYYSDSLTTGAANNYLLFGAGLGRVRVGDDVVIAGGVDRTQLSVTGYTIQTATVASIARADTSGTGVRPVLSLDFSGSGADNNGGSIPLLGRTSTTAASAIARLAWSLPTGTHASRKGRVSLYVSDASAERQIVQVDADGTNADAKIGSATTYLDVVDTGDAFFVGTGSGLPHGSCYGNEIGWSQASAAQNTWYVISDADMVDGHGGLNLVTHDGSGKLTVTKAGVYHVVYTVSQTNSGNNKHIQSGIALNGTVVGDGINHVDGLPANIDTMLGGNADLTMTAGQYIEIALRTTDTGTPDISVDHLNITISQVGG